MLFKQVQRLDDNGDGKPRGVTAQIEKLTAKLAATWAKHYPRKLMFVTERANKMVHDTAMARRRGGCLRYGVGRPFETASRWHPANMRGFIF